jgi:hypothetical protein
MSFWTSLGTVLGIAGAPVTGGLSLSGGAMTMGQMRAGATQPSQPAGVRVQAPNGETRMVKPESVQKYLARGMRVVN